MKKLKLLTPIIATTALATVLPIVACNKDEKSTDKEYEINFDETTGVLIDNTTYKLNEPFTANLSTEDDDLIVSQKLDITVDGRTLKNEYTTEYIWEGDGEDRHIVGLHLEIYGRYITNNDLTIVAHPIVYTPYIIAPETGVAYKGETRRNVEKNTWEQSVEIKDFVFDNITPYTDKSKLVATVTAEGIEPSFISTKIKFTGDRTFSVVATMLEGYFYSDEATCQITVSLIYDNKPVAECTDLKYKLEFDTYYSDFLDPNVNFSFDENGTYSGKAGDFYIINPHKDKYTEISLPKEQPADMDMVNLFPNLSVELLERGDESDNFVMTPVFTVKPDAFGKIQFKTYHANVLVHREDIKQDLTIECTLHLDQYHQCLKAGSLDSPLATNYKANVLDYAMSNPMYFVGYNDLTVQPLGAPIVYSYKTGDPVEVKSGWTVNIQTTPSNYMFYVNYGVEAAAISSEVTYSVKFSYRVSYTDPKTNLTSTVDLQTPELYIKAPKI